MHSLEQERNTRLNQLKKEIVTHPRAYIESVGKPDAHNLVDVVDDPDVSRKTALRLIMGATTLMPLRAVTYVESALQIASMLPDVQIQIVHANNLGQKINGISLRESNATALQLSDYVQNHLDLFPGIVSRRVLHAIDTPLDTDQYSDIVEQVVDDNDDIKNMLLKKEGKHGGDALRYAAAHYAFQDTNRLELQPLTLDSPTQADVDTIISIGCQPERLFYRTRMAMQAILPPEVRTSQLFTRHVVPPYYRARGGEETFGMNFDPPITSDEQARRDIMHYNSIYSEGNEL